MNIKIRSISFGLETQQERKAPGARLVKLPIQREQYFRSKQIQRMRKTAPLISIVWRSYEYIEIRG